jgi:hypothetical protein
MAVLYRDRRAIVKVILKTEYKTVDWIQLTQNRAHWRVLPFCNMNFVSHKRRGIYRLSERLSAFYERLWCMQLHAYRKHQSFVSNAGISVALVALRWDVGHADAVEIKTALVCCVTMETCNVVKLAFGLRFVRRKEKSKQRQINVQSQPKTPISKTQ